MIKQIASQYGFIVTARKINTCDMYDSNFETFDELVNMIKPETNS